MSDQGEISLGCIHASRKAVMAGVSEFVGMTMFVFVGCGAAAQLGNQSVDILANNLAVALTFGLAITVAIYMTAHRSGGHINPIVTLALMITGDCKFADGVACWIGQLLGSIVGVSLLAAMVDKDKSNELGANQIGGAYDWFNVGVGETFMSFMLVLVIYETAVHQNALTRPNKESRPILAPIPIGLMVFLAHVVLIPVDGCSINPARSFGPAIVALIRAEDETDIWKDFMAFVIFPFAGGAGAAVCVLLMRGAGYFMNASKQDMGLRRQSVFDTSELANAQIEDDMEYVDPTTTTSKDIEDPKKSKTDDDDELLAGDFSE